MYVSFLDSFLHILKVLQHDLEEEHKHLEEETGINTFLPMVSKTLNVNDAYLQVEIHNKQPLVLSRTCQVLVHQSFHSHNKEE